MVNMLMVLMERVDNKKYRETEKWVFYEKNEKETLKLKKKRKNQNIVTEMKNTFDGFISKLAMVK